MTPTLEQSIARLKSLCEKLAEKEPKKYRLWNYVGDPVVFEAMTVSPYGNRAQDWRALLVLERDELTQDALDAFALQALGRRFTVDVYGDGEPQETDEGVIIVTRRMISVKIFVMDWKFSYSWNIPMPSDNEKLTASIEAVCWMIEEHLQRKGE